MRPVIKGLLIGCVTLVILGIVAIGLAVWYVRENKDKLMAKAAEVRTEAQEFARTATESGCVVEALSQYRNDRSFQGQLRTRIWLDACLESSQPEESFCTGVPLTSEFTKTISWRLSECKRLGFENDSACSNMLTTVQDHCAKKRKN